MNKKPPPELEAAANYFPVAPRPPRSHFWPKRSKQQHAFDQLARKVGLRLLGEVPALNQPKYWPLVLSYSRTMILRERVLLHVTEQSSLLTDDGSPRHALAVYLRLDERLISIARELGVSPSTSKMVAQSMDLAAAFVELNNNGE